MQPQITRFQYMQQAIAPTLNELSDDWEHFPCLIWPFSKSPHGHGRLWYNNKNPIVSRLVYELAYSKPPAQNDVMQVCGDRLCFRPCHLRSIPPRIDYLREAVSRMENNLDAPWESVPCIDWPFILNENGYGIIVIKGKFVRVTRVAYEMKHGPFPKDLHILHRCDRPCCFQVHHLWPGTPKDNSMDMWQKGRGNPLRGESSPRARLTWDEVCEIRRLRTEQGLSMPELSRRFNANTGTISLLLRGLKWKVPR